MLTYTEVKKAIKERHENTKHFTPEFYQEFIKAQNTCMYNRINNINDTYKAGNVTLLHSYDGVYASKFYNLNGPAYCVLLEVVNQVKTTLKDILPMIKGPLWINEPKYDLSGYFDNVREVPHNMNNRIVDYITRDGNNMLTIEII